MEAAAAVALFEAAGNAGVCLAVCRGRADPCHCLKVFCLLCSDPLARDGSKEKNLSFYGLHF